MNQKTHIINFIVSLVIFTVGRVLVGANSGRLGLTGFAGYILCLFAILISICTIAVIIALKSEEKRNERKNS